MAEYDRNDINTAWTAIDDLNQLADLVTYALKACESVYDNDRPEWRMDEWGK